MNPAILAKELGTDLMLYDPVRDQVHILNATARLIYQLHQDGKDLDEIDQAIRSAFRSERHQNIKENIQACLAELKGKGLIPQDD